MDGTCTGIQLNARTYRSFYLRFGLIVRNNMRNGRRGQSLVELALVLPLLLLLIFGIIDFSYYIYGKATIQFAAFRGAQQAATQPPVTLNNTYSGTENDPCLTLIFDRTKAGTVGFTPAINQISFRWISTTSTITGTTETPIAPGTNRSTIVVPNTIVEVQVQQSVRPLTPLARTIFGNQNFVFSSRSRRTIMNIDVGPSQNCQS
jgi:Flp pilus assembly protein TadG